MNLILMSSQPSLFIELVGIENLTRSEINLSSYSTEKTAGKFYTKELLYSYFL